METTFLAHLRKAVGVSALALAVLAFQATPGYCKAKTAQPAQPRAATEESALDSDAMSGSDLVNASSRGVPAMDNVTPGDALANFGPSSGTVVGNRALELRDEVLRLRASANLNLNEFSLQRANGAAGAVQYHSTIAAITARLQNGTTKGNPILLRQWDEAEASLNEVTTSLNRLNSLQTAVAADSSLAGYLLESIQAAFQLSGAVDEDHDQLRLIRDETSRMIVQLDHLQNQITDDIQRQTTYATTERSNLQTLAFAISRGELLGNSSSRPVVVAPSQVMSLPSSSQPVNPFVGGNGPSGLAPTPMAAPIGQVGEAPLGGNDAAMAPSSGRLLVLIRYNKPVVDYEQQLSQAVSTALDRRPNAEFSVVAVAPASGEPSELARAQETASRNAESVKRSLVQLGLSPSHITMASTQTQTAQTPEVHVYIR
jgi:hypothetical protein